MNETAKEIIAMLSILKENSYSGNLQVARDFTIVKDCKKASFDFVIDQAIAYIINNKEAGGMKKKIKDITFFDVNEICLKAKGCDTCPLHIPSKCGYNLCLIGQLDHSLTQEWADILEQEVEI